MEHSMKNRALLTLCLCVVSAFLIFLLSGCTTSVCDQCGESFSGEGYYDILRDSDYTLCPDCAEQYYSPLPYEAYKK